MVIHTITNGITWYNFCINAHNSKVIPSYSLIIPAVIVCITMVLIVYVSM